MKPFRSTHAPERSIDECLLFLGTILTRAPINSEDWQFTDRSAHQAARPGWEVGLMQLDHLRKLVDRYAPDGIAIDPDLVDGAVTGWTAEKVQKNPPCEICGAERARKHLIEGAPEPHWLCATHEGFFRNAETSPCERCNADGATLHMASGRMLCTWESKATAKRRHGVSPTSCPVGTS